MDKAFVKKMENSLKNMRAKVIVAKGQAVEGLSKISVNKNNKVSKNPKLRETNV